MIAQEDNEPEEEQLQSKTQEHVGRWTQPDPIWMIMSLKEKMCYIPIMN